MTPPPPPLTPGTPPTPWSDRRLRLRVGLRRARDVVRVLADPATDWRAPLGPLVLGSSTVVLRPPRLADARAWREQRTAQRAHLQAWFAVDGDWAQEHSRLAWAEQVVGLTAAALLGLAQPHVVLLDGRLVGQLGVDAVDAGTATGELSGWSTPNPLGYSLTRVGTAAVCLAAVTGRRPLERLTAPVAVDNRGPGLLLASLGFEKELCLRRYRRTAAGRVDHDVWVLHRSPATIATLRAALEQEQARPSTARRTARLRAAPVGVHPDGPRPALADGVALARVAVRVAVSAVRTRRRPVTDWRVPLRPWVDAGGSRTVVLRAPELSDAGAWVRARRANAARLRRWLPGPADWSAAQTPLAWADHCLRSRALADRGAARPRVVEVDGVLAGEWGVVAVDHGTGTGELGFWLDARAVDGFAPHELSRLVGAAVALDAFTCDHPVERLQVPVAVGNTAAAAALAATGFADEGVLRAHRRTTAGPVDHHVWVLHREPAVLSALRTLVERPPAPRS